MEGLRGAAVLLVFLVHHHALFGGLLAPGGFAHQCSLFAGAIGHSGVDLFFLLSGYLIYGHLIKRPTVFGTFVRKRLRRTYPTFFVVFAIYCALSYAIPSVSKFPGDAAGIVRYLFENLLFLPGIFPIEPLITVAWSLSYEFFFYLSIPLLISATGMRKWKPSMRVLFFLALTAAHVAAFGAGLAGHIRLSMFTSGILLYETTTWGRAAGRLTRTSEAAAILFHGGVLAILGVFQLGGGLVAIRLGFPNYSYIAWTVLLFCSLYGVVLHSFQFPGLLRRFFSTRPLRWLGNMSYSYFLFHGLVLNGVAFAVHKLGWTGPVPGLLFPGVMAANLTLTLAGSRVLFLLVERPISLAPAAPQLRPVLLAEPGA